MNTAQYLETMPFPKKIMIEVTNICNHNCIFCANNKSIRKKGIIKKELAEKALKQAYELGCREVSFHAMGEPLICSDLSGYIAFAKDLGYQYIYIDSNGSLATPEVINPVIDAGLSSVKFSISAATKETYLKINGKDDFELVMVNLKALSAYKKATNKQFKFYVSFVENTYNKEEKEMFQQLFECIADEVWFEAVSNQGGNMQDENMGLEIDGNLSTMRLPCQELFERIVLTYDGGLIGCCMDFDNKLIYSNINKESLKSAWNNETMRRYRRCHLSKENIEELCHLCVFGTKKKKN